MKIYNEQDFIDIIRKDLNPLNFENFLKTKQIGKLWDKLKPDDIRIKTLKTKENFYKWCYDFIHNDEPLKYYFNKRLSYKEIKPVNIVDITDNAVKQKPNNVRLIRNINLESILDCRAFDGMSIKIAYKDALEDGKMCRFFTMPSVFKDSYKNDFEAFTVTMKTITGQMSIFSPSVYKTLLHESYKYLKHKKPKVLIPSASWASPILATKDNNDYSALHIVDVQSKVLKTSEELFKHIHNNGLFEELPYELKTFCVPSERMTEVIDDEYDIVFFCPPYYDLELYGGSDSQSTTLYKTYEEWLDLYWRKTVNECDKVLKSGGLFCFVMGRLCRGYEMGNDMKKIAEEKFNLINEIKILPPKEITKNNMHLNKYEICYLLNKN